MQLRGPNPSPTQVDRCGAFFGRTGNPERAGGARPRIARARAIRARRLRSRSSSIALSADAQHRGGRIGWEQGAMQGADTSEHDTYNMSQSPVNGFPQSFGS